MFGLTREANCDFVTRVTCPVDEPCQPGCSNLSFCSSFNNRPLELFRNCNPEADAAALNVFHDWIKMALVVLPGISLPVTCQFVSSLNDGLLFQVWT